MTRIATWTGLSTSTEMVTRAPSNGWLSAACRSPLAHQTSATHAAIWAMTKAANTQANAARYGSAARTRGSFMQTRSLGWRTSCALRHQDRRAGGGAAFEVAVRLHRIAQRVCLVD